MLNYSNESNHLNLIINRVTETHHNAEYTCRVTSPFGNQTKSTTLHVAQQSSTTSLATVGGAVVAVMLILLLITVGFVLSILAVRRYILHIEIGVLYCTLNFMVVAYVCMYVTG